MRTKIEWTDEVWNPVTGCTPVSAGCQNCYARRMARRLAGRVGYPIEDPFKVTFRPDRLSQPFSWRKPRKVFVCSMGDLFHEDMPDWAILAVWRVMAAVPWNTFMLLTKRPQRALEWGQRFCIMPLRHIWWGVSVEDQKAAAERIPLLFQIPAYVRFLSVEPMLERVDLGSYLVWGGSEHKALDLLHWVICGAETGPGARPMDLAWARDVRDQCRAAKVPFFIKHVSGRKEIPEDLMIREWPSLEPTRMFRPSGVPSM